MKGRRLTSLAGILTLAAAAFNILWLAVAFTRIVDVKELLRVTRVILPLPYIVLAIGFGGNTALSSILAIVFILGILLSVIGGVLTLRRRVWRLALVGSVGALICVPLLGIAAFVLTIMLKGHFAGREGL